MPTSTSIHITDILSIVLRIDPKTILDIGIGFGKWGFLFREYLDISGRHHINKKDWEITIDGVEIFKNYIQEHQKHIYNNIMIGNILDIVYDLPKYDLIFMSDVIEHLPKHSGYNLIEILKLKSKKLIIASPLGEWKQGPTCDNIYEEHISQWQKEDFDTEFYKIYTIGDKMFGIFVF